MVVLSQADPGLCDNTTTNKYEDSTEMDTEQLVHHTCSYLLTIVRSRQPAFGLCQDLVQSSLSCLHAAQSVLHRLCRVFAKRSTKL